MNFDAETEKIYQMITDRSFVGSNKIFSINVVLIVGKQMEFVLDLCCKLRNSRVKENIIDISTGAVGVPGRIGTDFSMISIDTGTTFFSIEIREFGSDIHRCVTRRNTSIEMTMYVPFRCLSLIREDAPAEDYEMPEGPIGNIGPSGPEGVQGDRFLVAGKSQNMYVVQDLLEAMEKIRNPFRPINVQPFDFFEPTEIPSWEYKVHTPKHFPYSGPILPGPGDTGGNE